MLSQREQLALKKSLTYANGYRELEMFDNALEELDSLNEAQRANRNCSSMRLAILMDAKKWKLALPFANRLASTENSDPGDLINLAYITRRANSIEGAKIILENAATRYPKEAIIQYNLGCYACCTNNLDTAMEYLKCAFQLDPAFIEMGTKDDDLISLKPWIEDYANNGC